MQAHTKLTLYHWNQLIQDACDYANINLKTETQGYLLLTLVSYIQNESLAEKAIALDLRFESTPDEPNYQLQLKAQADHCLILAGLFPTHIARQSYRISHYINLGAKNFQLLSELLDGNERIIYQQLADTFVELVDILHIIRCFNGSPAMPLIQAMELWSDTGSKTAYQILTTNRQSIPLNEALIDSTYKH